MTNPVSLKLQSSFLTHSARLAQVLTAAQIEFLYASKTFDTLVFVESNTSSDKVPNVNETRLDRILKHLDASIDLLNGHGVMFEYLHQVCDNTQIDVPAHDSDISIIIVQLLGEGAISKGVAQKASRTLDERRRGGILIRLEEEVVEIHEAMIILKNSFTCQSGPNVTIRLKNERVPNILVELGRMGKQWESLSQMMLFMRLAYGSKAFGTSNFSQIIRP